MRAELIRHAALCALVAAVLGCGGDADLNELPSTSPLAATGDAAPGRADAGPRAGDPDTGQVMEPTSGPDDPPDAEPSVAPAETPCGADTRWRCEGGARTRCEGGRVRTEACAQGCLAPPSAGGDARCIALASGWACASSDYRGAQYWTCDRARQTIFRCDARGVALAVRCEAGCVVGPLATHDPCAEPGAIPAPRITFAISGGLVTEAAVRGPVEEGVRYMLDRYARAIGGTTRRVPDITVRYAPARAGQTYCSGIAYAASTDIYCPYRYPVTGTNQNYVVNLTVHEIGHIVAQALIAHPSVRDHCVNEGLASWLAGRYWMNYASSPVGSLREAARRAIASGAVSARMDDCRLASDNWYKVYASFFEYLEGTPGAIFGVGSAAQRASGYVPGWRLWLQ